MSLLRCAGLKAVAHPVYNPKTFRFGWLGWIACDSVFTRAEALPSTYTSIAGALHRSVLKRCASGRMRAAYMGWMCWARALNAEIKCERRTHKHIYTEENAFSVFMSTQQPEQTRNERIIFCDVDDYFRENTHKHW